MELPSDFMQNLRALLPLEECHLLLESLQQLPPVSVRVNRLKMQQVPSGAAGCVPWTAEGYYLDKRPAFTFDPLFHAGCYYVQEASSMFLEQVVRQYMKEEVCMLDLCAAPGGKTTHARSLLPPGSLLVANEVVRSRLGILQENVQKWGHPDVIVTHNSPADFGKLSSFFDVVLVDAPCSGEGMFRKDAGAVDEWSAIGVAACQRRQRQILADVWPSLRAGGLLIYSTCTYNIDEDEANVRWLQEEWGAEPLPVDIQDEWGITGSLLSGFAGPVYRFLPYRTRGEGFFLALLRKPLDEGVPVARKPTRKAERKRGERGKGAAAGSLGKGHLRQSGTWLADGGKDYSLLVDGNRIVAFPARHVDALAELKQRLRVVQYGVCVGESKRNDLVPSHALALSPLLLRREAFGEAAVAYPQAIAYLRNESLVLPPEVPRGYVLLTYCDVPLGFVKNLGSRANNLYPKPWAIRNL